MGISAEASNDRSGSTPIQNRMAGFARLVRSGSPDSIPAQVLPLAQRTESPGYGIEARTCGPNPEPSKVSGRGMKRAWTRDKSIPGWLNRLFADMGGEPMPRRWFKRIKSECKGGNHSTGYANNCGSSQG